jgi:hypothetical protein
LLGLVPVLIHGEVLPTPLARRPEKEATKIPRSA